MVEAINTDLQRTIDLFVQDGQGFSVALDSITPLYIIFSQVE
jgi:hypothetical protein